MLVELDDTSQRNVILRVYECQVLDKEQSDYVILLLFPYRDPAETCVEKGFQQRRTAGPPAGRVLTGFGAGPSQGLGQSPCRVWGRALAGFGAESLQGLGQSPCRVWGRVLAGFGAESLQGWVQGPGGGAGP